MFIVSSMAFTKKAPTDIITLGQNIFNAIKSENKEQLLDLIVTNEEMIETIDDSNLSDSIKASFKSEFITMLNEKSDKTTAQIIKGYTTIRNDIDNKKCGNSITLGRLTENTSHLKNLPIELGHLEIEYLCKKKSSIIDVEIINTTRGWRILEKLRLRAKEKK